MSKPQSGGATVSPRRGTAAPTEEYYRAHGYRRLQVRLPAATLRQLEQLAKARGMARVTVLCDLIQEASK
jgi:hypothetical protein